MGRSEYSLVIYYLYGCPHKDRKICVCHDWSNIAIAQPVFRASQPFGPCAAASGLYLAVHAASTKKKNNFPFFFSFFPLLFPSLVTGKGSIFPSIFGHKEQHQSAVAF